MIPANGGTASMAAILATALASCSDSPHHDLQAFVDAAEQPSIGTVAATPSLSAPAPFTYTADGLRNPFEPPPPSRGDGERTTALAAPDLQRPKTRLEEFPVEALRMVGTLEYEGAQRALVRDPLGDFHAVRVGDYLGADFGRVRAIGAAAIELVESIADGSGGWVTRPRTLALSDTGRVSQRLPEPLHEQPAKE